MPEPLLESDQLCKALLPHGVKWGPDKTELIEPPAALQAQLRLELALVDEPCSQFPLRPGGGHVAVVVASVKSLQFGEALVPQRLLIGHSFEPAGGIWLWIKSAKVPVEV